MPQAEFVVALSHDNYLKVVGGVQLCVGNEQRIFNENKVGYIHFFPTNHRPTLARPEEPFYVSISCNGQFVAEFQAESALELLDLLAQAPAKKTLSRVILHQLMGFNIDWVHRLVKESGRGKALFWVHDYFSLCPSYALMRNDIVFCNAPPVSSNSCLICIYGEERAKHLQAFHRLFNDLDLMVVACSQLAEQVWKEKAGFHVAGSLMMPHCYVQRENTKRTSNNILPPSPLKIAFVGLTTYYKGGETWEYIVRRFGSDTRYKFFHFAVQRDRSLPQTFIFANVTSENRHAMVDALKTHHIDVVFLWSVCSETFSFRLHEAMAAGCYVVTHPDSGNIQATVLRTNCGAVLTDEQEMAAWLDSDRLTGAVREFQDKKARFGSLVFSPGSYKIVFETEE
jgi:glycosyltransferase involved in cell wall biosynthesis